jgi:hypothetical protein
VSHYLFAVKLVDTEERTMQPYVVMEINGHAGDWLIG